MVFAGVEEVDGGDVQTYRRSAGILRQSCSIFFSPKSQAAAPRKVSQVKVRTQQQIYERTFRILGGAKAATQWY